MKNRGLILTINETHLRPQNQNPTTDARVRSGMEFVKNIIDSTHFLKNGWNPGSDNPSGIRSFSSQKARAIRLSDYSFPVFIIRKPRQRSSYSKQGEGIDLEIPSHQTDP